MFVYILFPFINKINFRKIRTIAVINSLIWYIILYNPPLCRGDPMEGRSPSMTVFLTTIWNNITVVGWPSQTLYSNSEKHNRVRDGEFITPALHY